MNEETNAKAQPGPGEAVGAILLKAREAAAIDINKICSDLRISPQALEALEQGNYHLLPGDPYIRALLGSLGRYLGLDPIALVTGYNKEIGAVHAAPSIAPYKDRASTHTAAHKQIFIAIFAVLIVVLFLLINQLKKGDSDAVGAPPAPAIGAVSDSLALPQDTLESKSLVPDTASASVSPESPNARAAGGIVKPALPGATLPAPTAAPAAIPAPAASAPVAPPAELNSAVVKPLIDSVGVKVVRFGKEDFGTVLRLGKQMAVSHSDTIVIMISKRRAVEVTLGGKTVIPDRKRFKIYGTTLKTF